MNRVGAARLAFLLQIQQHDHCQQPGCEAARLAPRRDRMEMRAGLCITLLLLSAGTPALLSGRQADNGTAAPAAALPRELAALRSELDRTIRQPTWRGDQWSVLVVSLDRGDTLYALQPDLSLAPASNMKLFTSAAALYYLGPDFRYSTYLMTGGRLEHGTLRGDLIIYGTGDPTIGDRLLDSKLAVWEAFADSLQALGIRRIEGAIVGDASYFTDSGVGTGWRESYMNAWYAAPASGLSFNENIVTLRVRPAAQVGWRPEIDLIPGGDGIAIVNQATTVASGRSWIDVNRVAYDGPIIVRGQIARGHAGVWNAVPVADPARYTAAVFQQVLQRRGIEATEGIRSVQLPAESPVTGRSVFAPAFDNGAALRVLAVHKSPPLQQILEVVNRRSHNLYAESVLRTVGRVAAGEGTIEGGARAIAHMLRRETGGVPEDLAVFDGSGLSPLNRASARTLIRLLGYMADSPMWEAYWGTLPEAGSQQRDGLRRMQNTAAGGNLRAKTGTIERVSALSGYVRASNGERLAFAIVVNGAPSTWQAKRIEDAIGARLAGFTRPATATGAARLAETPAPEPLPGSNGDRPTAVAARTAALDTTAATAVSAPPAGADVADARPGPAAAEAPPAAEPAEARSYEIRPGDTLDAIARAHGTTVAALRAANPGVDPRRLRPGRTIVLP
jgi:serine-type D-Ala-D-Ala carboxypeptidase/endopeptidase (penicillin-binding protein 4)